MSTIPVTSAAVNPASYGYGFGAIVGPIRVLKQTITDGTHGLHINTGFTEGFTHGDDDKRRRVCEEEVADEGPHEDIEVLERCLVEGTSSPLTIKRHIVASLYSCDVGAEYPEWKSPLWDFVWRLKVHP